MNQTKTDQIKAKTAVAERGDDQEWMSIAERGSVTGIYFLVALVTMFGRTIPRMVVAVVVGYYYVFYAKARRATRRYYRHLTGEEPTRWACYCHILRFGQVALDRLFFGTGRVEKFDITSHGRHHLREALDAGEGGALLLGAHLGSFAAMRGAADSVDLKINAVTYNANSELINGVLDKMDPDANVRVIDISDDRIAAILTIRERLEAGEYVAILSDRVGTNDKSVEAEFLGQPASFPVGGFLLAAMLDCPVYTVFGLYRGKNVYELYCEPFRQQICLPRGPERHQALRRLAQAYADRLEAYCRRAPDNWFNFYNYWGEA